MKKRILIIDDDLSVRDSLKKVLQETGYQVVLAADGQEGADCLGREEFDLLILDLDLPRLSGFDVIDIKTERRPSLPVIILTGLFDQCEPGALAGVDALIEKPADVCYLLSMAGKLLNEAPSQRLRRLSLALTLPSPGRIGLWRSELPTKPLRPASGGSTNP